MERMINRWQLDTTPVMTGIGVFAIITFMLTARLVTIHSGLAAPSEQQAIATIGWHALLHNPLYAPYYVLLRAITYAGHTLLLHRLVSVAFGLASTVMFYYVVHRWFGYRLAAIGTLLFGTSSMLLNSSRIVSPEILVCCLILGLLVLFSTTYKSTGYRPLWAWLVLSCVLMYIPGALWIILGCALVCNRRLRIMWSIASLKHKFLLSVLAIALLLPLIWFLLPFGGHAGTVFHRIALLSGITVHGSILASLDAYTRQFASIPVHLFWHGDGSFVAGLPVIDIAVTALSLLGLYVCIGRRRDSRWQFMLVLLAISWLLVGLGIFTELLLIPVLYVLATIGLAYLLSEWYHVFPRNPIARYVGLTLVIILVFTSSLYNLRTYFVAWTHNRVTEQTFICPADPPRPSACPQGDI